ncbi:hypothetical protein CRP01_10580 [Flavilitoribacter nigricans DSM 23189 = NBRC 102662]|uniref:Uncharacterized protein n=2 Tax=Flavilitoribacter TaxID=2762562 RepID=A0A2D0NEF9_FLAN2|nr:hypothetical protein CRP01_10580 [Flavilitoribacter nigricans DSM 23189 = NBRC 102662]
MAASAQTATPKVADRQVNQQKRIIKGAKDGEVSKKEAVRLERQQKRINRSKKRAKADGEVTKKERAKLHARQNKASRNIKRAKKNNN